jgi:putative membrane protein
VAQLIVFLALLFSILIAIFAVQNTTSVPVRFLTFGPLDAPVAVLVLISAALGALAMLLLGIAREARLRWRQRAVGQQLRAAQARIAELEKAQPLAASAATAEPAVSPTPPAPETQSAER